MAFAPQNYDLSYWQKQSKPLFDDLLWNIPEQKTGHIAIIGGNSQSFSTVARTAEYLIRHFPFASVTSVLPDSLQSKIPSAPNLLFTLSTESGSFAKSARLDEIIAKSNANLLIGDLSKNSATAIALAHAIMGSNSHHNPNISNSDNPAASSNLLVITRDSVDLLATEAENWLVRPHTIIVASMAQLQNLFRNVYYPRMIMLSQPLLPVLETLHKFTLSYPVTLLTYHQEQIIVASNGQVSTTHIIDTSYSPITLWSGQLAANVLALNLYNPNQPYAATTAAVLYH